MSQAIPGARRKLTEVTGEIEKSIASIQNHIDSLVTFHQGPSVLAGIAKKDPQSGHIGQLEGIFDRLNEVEGTLYTLRQACGCD